MFNDSGTIAKLQNPENPEKPPPWEPYRPHKKSVTLLFERGGGRTGYTIDELPRRTLFGFLLHRDREIDKAQDGRQCHGGTGTAASMGHESSQSFIPRLAVLSVYGLAAERRPRIGSCALRIMATGRLVRYTACLDRCLSEFVPHDSFHHYAKSRYICMNSAGFWI